MTFYIPSNLNIDSLIETSPPNIPSFNKEKLLFIVHSIIHAKANERGLLGDGYVTLNATVLKNVIGNGYNRYIMYLRVTKVIELYIAAGGGTYSVGKHSQAYRLSRNYLTQVTRYEVTTFTLERKIKQYFKSEVIEARQKEAESRTMVDEVTEPIVRSAAFDFTKLGEPKPSVPKKATKKVKAAHKSDVLNKREFTWEPTLFKGMYKWLEDGGLSINRELVNKYLNIRLAVHYVDKDSREREWGEKEPKNPIEQFNAATILLDKLDSGEHDAHFDYSIRRFYNVISLMPKMLRNGLTYNGEKLAVIDISNSQPYMSNLFFNPGFWEGTASTNLKLIDLGLSASLIFPSAFPSFIMFLKSGSNAIPATLSLDYGRYKYHTSRGSFYKYVNEKIGKINGLERLHDDISLIKRDLYILFFSNNNSNPKNAPYFKPGFKAIFPTIYDVFSKIKQSNKHNLAHLYFLVETYVMFYKIVTRIQKELPKVPFWTIHDGIATTVGNEAAMGAIMEEELTKAIGVKPHMKIEPLVEETLLNEIAEYEATIEFKGLLDNIKKAKEKGEIRDAI